jgi:hypothetical protein
MKRCLSSGNVSVNASTNESFVIVTNNMKAKRGRQKNQISATQPLSLTACNDNSESMSPTEMDTIFSSVVNPVDTKQCSSNSILPPVNDKCRCDEMKAETISFKGIVNQLSIKIDFLMSYIGLKEYDNTASD